MTTQTDGPPHDDPRIRAVRRVLAEFDPGPLPELELGRDPSSSIVTLAGVALLVRPRPEDLEVLLIERARVAGDPWSGHIALPGGRMEPRDRDLGATAARETHEEVGIDLRRSGTLLGRLHPVAPRPGGPRISVSPFVFAVPSAVEPTPNREVASAFWVAMRRLDDPASVVEHAHVVATGDAPRRFPAIGYRDFVIWGLTHRILTQFLELTREGRAAYGE